MPEIITTLDILLPLLLAAFLVWFMLFTVKVLKTFRATLLDVQQFLEKDRAKVRNDNDDDTKAATATLRLQACERFTLMTERISVPNLLLRLPPASGVSAKEHTATLLLNIRQEFEYNVTQQIYVSDALWNVLLQARDNVSQLIVRAAEGADTGAQLASRLRVMSANQPADAIALAQSAIRREATQVLL